MTFDVVDFDRISEFIGLRLVLSLDMRQFELVEVYRAGSLQTVQIALGQLDFDNVRIGNAGNILIFVNFCGIAVNFRMFLTRYISTVVSQVRSSFWLTQNRI